MTEEEDPPLGWIAVTVIVPESSGSLSSVRTSSCEPVFVTVAPALTVSVSLTATGSSLAPKTVIVIFAVVVAVPSERV